MGNPVKYYDPEGEAGELTLTWTSGAWWLVGADGPLPVGDLIFVGGVVVAVIIGGILVNVSKKYQKPPNPNRRKGAENRGPNPNAPGKNEQHGNCENHSKRPKGGTKLPSHRGDIII